MLECVRDVPLNKSSDLDHALLVNALRFVVRCNGAIQRQERWKKKGEMRILLEYR